MMTAVKEMDTSCRCNILLVSVGFGLSVIFAPIIIQYSTVVQLQTMTAEVNFIKEQLQQQQQQVRDGDVTQAPCDQTFHVSAAMTQSQ